MQQPKHIVNSNFTALTLKSEKWADRQRLQRENPKKYNKNIQKEKEEQKQVQKLLNPLKKQVLELPKKQCKNCNQNLVLQEKPYPKNEKTTIITWKCDLCSKTYDTFTPCMQCINKNCKQKYDMCIPCFKIPTEKTKREEHNIWVLKYIKQIKQRARKYCTFKMCWSKSVNQGFICENCQQAKDQMMRIIVIRELEVELYEHNQNKEEFDSKEEFQKKQLELEINIANKKYQNLTMIPKYEQTKEQTQEKIDLCKYISEKNKELYPIKKFLEIEKIKQKIRNLKKNPDPCKYSFQEKLIKYEIEILNLQIDIFQDFPSEQEPLQEALQVKKIHLQLVNDWKYMDVKLVQMEEKKNQEDFVKFRIETEILNLVLYLYKNNQNEVKKIQRQIEKLEKHFQKNQEKKIEKEQNLENQNQEKQDILKQMITTNVAIHILEFRLRYIRDDEEDRKTQIFIDQNKEQLKQLKTDYFNLNKKSNNKNDNQNVENDNYDQNSQQEDNENQQSQEIINNQDQNSIQQEDNEENQEENENEEQEQDENENDEEQEQYLQDEEDEQQQDEDEEQDENEEQEDEEQDQEEDN